jgi:hypothetical protein
MESKELCEFIGRDEMLAIREALRGEESGHFKQKIREVVLTIEEMPKTYETDGQGDAAIVHLHYFLGGSDWYIVEKDGEAERLQAFGLAILGNDAQNAEMGYISIRELIDNGAELDLYFGKKSIGEVKTEKRIPWAS